MRAVSMMKVGREGASWGCGNAVLPASDAA